VKILNLEFFALVFSVVYRRENPVFSIFSQHRRLAPTGSALWVKPDGAYGRPSADGPCAPPILVLRYRRIGGLLNGLTRAFRMYDNVARDASI
jgi:hypothetical protein